MRYLFPDELKLLHPETQFPLNTHFLKILISPSSLSVSRSDYLQILKIINFNLSFDDGFDGLYVFDYEINKLFVPVQINISVRIEELRLTLLEQGDNSARIYLEVDSFDIWYLRDLFLYVQNISIFSL
jgi:hypothetical protein